MSATPKVYAAIGAVTRELAQVGIGKERRNQQQGYAFRGIDDVLNALGPALARHALCMLPTVVSRTLTERPSKSGGALYSVVVEVDFALVSTDDGSSHTIRIVGEAMDSADKATNKAMSAAYKYAALLAFAIPVEGAPDADESTPEPAPVAPSSAPASTPAEVERDRLRRVWHARLRDLGVDLSEADRHAVQAELLGAASMSDVDPQEARRRLQSAGLRLNDAAPEAMRALGVAVQRVLDGRRS